MLYQTLLLTVISSVDAFLRYVEPKLLVGIYVACKINLSKPNTFNVIIKNSVLSNCYT